MRGTDLAELAAMPDVLRTQDAIAAGVADVIGGRSAIELSVERVASRLRDRRTTVEAEPISARRIRDTGELLTRERDARRLLEAEKAIRERLLATMTRELVTQANVARGWLNLLRREHLDARAREMVFSKVEGALDAQLSLVDELVGMSPVAAGHVNLDLRCVDVAAVARAVAADVGDERAHVIAAQPAVVVADMEHVVRALRALIEATTRTKDSVRLRVVVSGDSVHVRFSDVIRDDDEAVGVARRVATLYGGAITVVDGETLLELPIASSY